MAGPPLDVGVVVQRPSGQTFRWDPDARRRIDRPSDLAFGTKLLEGFAQFSCTLPRGDAPWADLNEYDTLKVIGLDGSSAYEGRLGPRQQTAGGRSKRLTVQAASWMSHGRDRQSEPFIYVESDHRKWGGMPNAAKQEYQSGTTWSPADGRVEDAGIVTQLAQPPWASPALPITEAWYSAPPGAKIDRMTGVWEYFATVAIGSGTYAVVAYLSATEAKASAGDYDGTGDMDGSGAGPFSLDATKPDRIYAVVQFFYAANNATADNEQRAVLWTAPKLYGPHGLTIQADGGLLATDVILDSARRWAPLLDTSLLEPTGTSVLQAVLDKPTDPYDLWVSLNRYDLRNLAVWENRQLTNYELDLDNETWRVRSDEAGVTVKYGDGELGDRLNGVIVLYTDIDTGRASLLTPDDDYRLTDDDPAIPANQAGVQNYKTLDLSEPTSRELALQHGEKALRLSNGQRRPAVITITGYVRNAAGHPTQPWKVRAGQTILVEDEAGALPRLVTETNYTGNNYTVTATVDSGSQNLDALMTPVLGR